MALTTVPVTAKYVNADGTVAHGDVTLQLTHQLRDATDKLIVTTVPIKKTLDSTGNISVTMYADDDTVVLPTGVQYTVVENITGGTTTNNQVSISHTMHTSGYDLSSLPT